MPGGAGSVLASKIAQWEPDGYKFGFVPLTTLSAMPHMRSLPFTSDDFTYVFVLRPDPLDIVVLKDSSYETFEQLIEDAKKKPGRLTYSHCGVGLYDHLVIEWIGYKLGVKFTGVPTTSGPESMAQVIGEHVTFGSGSGSHIPYVKGGQMRVLLETDSFRRWGSDVRNIVDVFGAAAPVNTSFAYLGPKNVPKEIVRKMQEALKVAAEEPVYKKLCGRFNIIPVYSYENLKEEIEKDYKEMGEFLKKVGLSEK